MMKNILGVMGMSAALTLAGGLMGAAYADGGCSAAKSACTAAEKAACTAAEKAACDAGAKSKEVSDAGCAKACSSTCTASAKGADEDMIKAGYGLGERVPSFSLNDTTGKTHTLSDYKGKVTMIVFYNQGCPYVVEMWDRLSDFTTKYADKDVVVLALDAGDSNSAEAIAEHAKDRKFPILVDRTSNSARNFSATRTPEVFLLNRDGVVSYHGAFDNGARGAEEGTRRTYAADAVDALLRNEEPLVNQTKAFGCTIKFNKEYAAK